MNQEDNRFYRTSADAAAAERVAQLFEEAKAHIAKLERELAEAQELLDRQRHVIRGFSQATRRGDLILTREPQGRARGGAVMDAADALLGTTRSGEPIES